MNAIDPMIDPSLYTKKVEDEQLKIQNQLDSNQKERTFLKGLINNMLTATVMSTTSNQLSPEENPDAGSISSDSASSSNSRPSFKSTKSVESIDHISTDGTSALDTTLTPVEDLPEEQLMEKFLLLSDSGKLDLSDEFKQELYRVNSRIDSLDQISSGLQQRWFEIDATIDKIKLDIISIKQYQMIDNLLLHSFPLPNVQMTSLEFSQYVATELNALIPQLPVPVKWEYISTAHPLPTKARLSNVVVVRFSNRNIKDMIYRHKDIALQKGVLITEHLIDSNKSICDKAKELFPFNCTIRTESCKIYIDIDGISNRVSSVHDVRKLFVKYCEFIGSKDDYTFLQRSVVPRKTTCYVPKPTYSDCAVVPSKKYSSSIAPRHSISYRNNSALSSNYRGIYLNNLSRRPKVNHFRGKRSTGYSVYNRKY